jgi:23S rRNA (uracil1939-C5)-methyltransferase
MEAEIESLASNGCGILRHEGRPVFVPWTVPGDRVEWQVRRDRGRFCEGSATRLLKASADRVNPPCPWFESCGGCQLQMASQAAQAEAKGRWIFDAFTRIGGFQLNQPPVVHNAEPYEYRRRISLRILDTPGGPALAYAGSKGGPKAVFPDACLLLSRLPLLRQVADCLTEASCPALDKREARAWIYHLQEGYGCWLRVPNHASKWLESLQSLLRIPHWQAVAVEDHSGLHQRGRWGLCEEIEGIRFHLAPTSFLQGHQQLSRLLWSDVIHWAAQQSGSILDLYSGIGVTGLLCAQRGLPVTMVEADRALTEAARHTADQHQLHASIRTALVEEVLPEFQRGQFATLLLNPPRPGVSAEAIDHIERLAPDRISYVSCHPATCARDLRLLSQYELESVAGYDLFPQTAHVECWVTLRRKG